MNDPPSQNVVCLPPQVSKLAIDEICAKCGAPNAETTPNRTRARRWSLRSVMGLIAVIAVCLAPLRISIPVSLVMFVLLVPTTLRGLLILEDRKIAGQTMTFRQRLLAFVNSGFITTVIAGVSALVLLATFLLLKNAAFDGYGDILQLEMTLVIAVAGISAVVVACFLMGRYWLPKDRIS